MKKMKKKTSMQSDFKIITEVTTEVAITTTEEIEVEPLTSTLTQTEEDNKPHNTGAIPTGEETQTEEIEEATLKGAALNNTHSKLKTMEPTNKDKNNKMCSSIELVF